MENLSIGLDMYLPRTPEMNAYLYAHGWHFNEKMEKFAASLMTKRNPSTEKEEQIDEYSKEHVDEMLKRYGVEVKRKNKSLWDYVYIANDCQANCLKSSVPDEQHLALHIKDMIDDVDAPDGMIFAMWYAKMNRAGIPIPWEAML